MDTQTPIPDAPPGPSSPDAAPAPSARPAPGLGAELRESLVLLGCAVALTVGITTAAQAALTVLA